MSDAPAQEQVAAPVAAPAAEVTMTDAAAVAAPAAVEAPVVAAAPVEEKKAEEAPKQQTRPDNRQQPKQFKKFVSKSKYDASVLPISDDPVEIRKQVCTLRQCYMRMRLTYYF